MSTPSEKLNKRSHPIRVAVIAVAVALGIGGIGTGAALAAPNLMPHPKPTATLEIAGPDTSAAYTVGQGVAVTPDQLAEAQQQEQGYEDAKAKAAADAASAAQAAADAAAQQAAAEKAAQQKKEQTPSTGGSGLLPAGSVVPSISGTTSPDTTRCASGTASNNASGVAVCD